MWAAMQWWQWTILTVAGLLIGMSKTGFQGINTPTIPLLALAFGARESTGIILPLLCMADLIAVLYYRRNAQWKYIGKLLPSAVAGFFLALAIDRFIPPEQFRYLMAACILAGLVFVFWQDRSGKKLVLTQKWWYSPAFWLTGGFTTMIGNAAGPVMAIYLLSMKLPKYTFVGTSAWFFLIVNYLKLPLQIFVWNNISWESAAVDAMVLPAILLGAGLGIKLVKRLPKKNYRKLILWLTVVSTAMLLI
ncbi:MAG: sulfite exporter TauE/SafE family protein [Rikenellaceae bacterium]|nr:sulfite exporter TauE/SafE family protein [Rikenellaceae bacterium]